MSPLFEPVQTALGDALPLTEIDFVVVDLETTGGSPVDDGITEIGAVQVPRPRAHRGVPVPRRPRAADPALHRAPDRYRRSACRRRAGVAADPAELPGVRPRRRHRRAQRHVRCRLPQRQPASPRLRGPCRLPRSAPPSSPAVWSGPTFRTSSSKRSPRTSARVRSPPTARWMTRRRPARSSRACSMSASTSASRRWASWRTRAARGGGRTTRRSRSPRSSRRRRACTCSVTAPTRSSTSAKPTTCAPASSPISTAMNARRSRTWWPPCRGSKPSPPAASWRRSCWRSG